jgi:ketosteroid isomerase-like protein
MRNALFVAVALAAGAPAAAQQSAAPAGLDSTAARLLADSLGARYAAALVSGDPAAVASHFADNATTSYFGFPTTIGRANIQALYAAAFGVSKPTAARIVTNTANGSIPGLITTLGTNTETVDSAGKRITTVWRYASVIRKDTDGQWRFGYVMAFPDSVSRGK